MSSRPPVPGRDDGAGDVAGAPAAGVEPADGAALERPDDGKPDEAAAEAGAGSDPGAPGGRPSARDLVRRRRRDYRAPETGRHHHIGAAPARQPVLGEGMTETASVQLAQRTLLQLHQARERYAARMQEAAQDMDFELAAQLRDAVAAVDAELARRSGD